MFDKLKYVIGDRIREKQIAAAEGGKSTKGGKHRKGPKMCSAKKTHTIKGSKHIHHECTFEPAEGNTNGECGRKHLCRHWEVGCDYQWD